MRNAVLLAALAAAVAAPSATAGTGAGPPADGQAQVRFAGQPATTLVSGPTRIDPSTLPGGGIGTPAGPASGAAKGASTAAGSCGACIVTCWGATARTGSADWSGHAYIYQYLSWCGNGAVVTYAAVSQGYEQVGWYVITWAAGPWWSGGCIGCGSIRASGYILWDWRMPLVSIHTAGTSRLDTTLWAYGGVSF